VLSELPGLRTLTQGSNSVQTAGLAAKMTDVDQDEKAKQLAQAWEILKLNVTFSNHFDFKYAPVLTVSTALLALLGAALKDRESQLAFDTPYGPLTVALASLAVMSLLIAIWKVLTAVSPSLTLKDKSINILGWEKMDDRPQSFLFFSDIARMAPDAEQYRQHLSDRLQSPDTHMRDLSDQIIEIATITHRKAGHIRNACAALVWGLLFGVATFIMLLATKVS
jgi:hypothetical protein